MKQAISNFKNAINAATAASHDIRTQIRASSGDERWDAWQRKRRHGAGTRVMLLAYACVRGMPYGSVERKCAAGNEPSASAINTQILAQLSEDGPSASDWTRDRVRAWLAASEPCTAACAAQASTQLSAGA